MPIMDSALLSHDGHAYCKYVVKAQPNIRQWHKLRQLVHCANVYPFLGLPSSSNAQN